MMSDRWIRNKGIEDRHTHIQRVNKTKSEDMYLLNKEYFESENDGFSFLEKGPYIEYTKTVMVAAGPLYIDGDFILHEAKEHDEDGGTPIPYGKDYIIAYYNAIK
jgi:hypothetical protein